MRAADERDPQEWKKARDPVASHSYVMRQIELDLFMESTSLEIRPYLPEVMLHLEADLRALHEPEPLRPIDENKLYRRWKRCPRVLDRVPVLEARQHPDIVVSRDCDKRIPPKARLRPAAWTTGICREQHLPSCRCHRRASATRETIAEGGPAVVPPSVGIGDAAETGSADEVVMRPTRTSSEPSVAMTAPKAPRVAIVEKPTNRARDAATRRGPEHQAHASCARAGAHPACSRGPRRSGSGTEQEQEIGIGDVAVTVNEPDEIVAKHSEQHPADHALEREQARGPAENPGQVVRSRACASQFRRDERGERAIRLQDRHDEVNHRAKGRPRLRGHRTVAA